MKIVFTKRNILVLIICLVLCALFVFVWITHQKTSLLSQSEAIPAPYNQFNYSYIVAHSSPSSSDLSYLLYVNQALIESTSTHSAIYSDGKGFYQEQRQSEQPIACGNQQLSAGSSLDSFSQGCVSANGKNYVVAGAPYYVNGNYVIYEQCDKMIFYPSYGVNGCGEYSLKVNDTVIDTSSEGYDYIDNTSFSAPTFGNVKVDGDVLTYIKSYQSPISFGRDEFISYNLSSNVQKVEYSSPDNSWIANAQLIDGKPAILLRDYSGIDPNTLNGMTGNDRVNYLSNILDNAINASSSLLFADGTKIDNLGAFASNNGHLYFLQKNVIATVSNDAPSTFLFEDNLGVLGFTPNLPQGPQILGFGIYPDCDHYPSVCLYDDGDYIAMAELTYSAAQNIPSAYTYDGIIPPSIDGHIPASTLSGPTIYYPNGIKMGTAFEESLLPDTFPFVFSSNGDTYLVYSYQNIIYGEDVSSGDNQPVLLFGSPNSPDSIFQFRVFPK